jgi:hypothetical protein
MFVGVPVFDDSTPLHGVPLVRTSWGWASPGHLVWSSCAALSDDLGPVSTEELVSVEDRLAEILLLTELARRVPVPPKRGQPPSSAHPLWGATYHAGPPIGGQNKRWVVVSHDHFNRATGRALCVRTTSNLSFRGPTSPQIERGGALAICDDVASRAQSRFDLASSSRITQSTVPELTAVARGLVNALQLGRAAGLLAS